VGPRLWDDRRCSVRYLTLAPPCALVSARRGDYGYLTQRAGWRRSRGRAAAVAGL